MLLLRYNLVLHLSCLWGFICLVPFYLPAIGKTWIYVLETLKSLAGCSSLQVLGPDNAHGGLPKSNGITARCYFQTKKLHCWF